MIEAEQIHQVDEALGRAEQPGSQAGQTRRGRAAVDPVDRVEQRAGAAGHQADYVPADAEQQGADADGERELERPAERQHARELGVAGQQSQQQRPKNQQRQRGEDVRGRLGEAALRFERHAARPIGGVGQRLTELADALEAIVRGFR